MSTITSQIDPRPTAPAEHAMQSWREGALPIETILAVFAIEAGIEVSR